MECAGVAARRFEVQRAATVWHYHAVVEVEWPDRTERVVAAARIVVDRAAGRPERVEKRGADSPAVKQLIA
jgi:hypothetical protein